jgi:actin-like ATPase involved in cell morphogenesis
VRAIGLDLGTAHLRAAAMVAGVPTFVQDTGGATAIPAVVSFQTDGIRAGTAALHRAALHPQGVVRGIKRLLGHADVFVGNERLPVRKVAVCLLEHMLGLAQQQLGSRPENAVVAVPAWFRPGARAALIEAVELAGLRVQRVILEPTAAALAIPPLARGEQRVAVVDAGAGGVSAALLVLGPGRLQLLAAVGDDQAGGEAVDLQLTDEILQDLSLEHSSFTPEDPRLELLRQSLERLKRDLHSVGQSNAPAFFLHDKDGNPVNLSLTRARMDRALGDTLARVETCCLETLAKAGLHCGDVDVLILAGGMVRLQSVRERIEHVMGRKAAPGFEPAEVVTAGAAMLADSIARGTELERIDETCFESRSFAPGARPPGGTLVPSKAASAVPGAAPPKPESHAPLQPAEAAPDAQPPPYARAHAIPPPRAAASAPAAEPAAPPATARPHPAPTVPPWTGSVTGQAFNVQDFAQLLELPMVRGCGPDEHDRMALPILLIHAVARPAMSGTLLLEHAARSASLMVVAGRAHMDPAEHASVCKAFLWPELTYTFDGKRPNVGHRPATGMVRLLVDGLKTLGRSLSVQQLEKALGERLRLAPVVRTEREHVLRRLGLDSRELRLVEGLMDGTNSGQDLVKSGAGPHTTLQLLVLLTAFELVDWHEVVARRGFGLAERLTQQAARAEKVNHFDALGVHWSAGAEEIQAAYQSLCRKLSHGTAEYAAAPETCARILKRAEAAVAALSDPNDILRLRREACPGVDFDALNDFLKKRVESLEMRTDTRELKTALGTRKEVAAVGHYKDEK